MGKQLFLSVIEMRCRAALNPQAWMAFMDAFEIRIKGPGGNCCLYDKELYGILLTVPSPYYSGERQSHAIAYWHPKETRIHDQANLLIGH